MSCPSSSTSLSNYPRDINVGWYGGNLELLKMFAAAQRAIRGYAGRSSSTPGPRVSVSCVRHSPPLWSDLRSCVRRYLCVRLLVACGRSRANRFQGNASSRRTFDGFPSYHLSAFAPLSQRSGYIENSRCCAASLHSDQCDSQSLQKFWPIPILRRLGRLSARSPTGLSLARRGISRQSTAVQHAGWPCR